MNTVKRVISSALVLCLTFLMLTGCNGIVKTDVEDNTLTVNLPATSAKHIRDALEKKFPDISFVIEEYAGSNTSRYQKEQLVRGLGGDLFFYTTFLDSENVGKYLVNLSGYSFLANYDKSILSTLDVNGAIYQIPGPITVRYVAVNKTLFEEKGWKIPENFEETVALCRQIREEEPDIAPLAVGSLGMGFIWTLVTSYTQMGFLDTTQGQTTEENFRKGTVSFGDVFDEGLDMVAQLVDAGAFMPERFIDTWDVTPEQMYDREAAMCYIMGPSVEHAKLFSGELRGNPEMGEYCNDEFEALPLFGKNPKNKGLILGASNTWGISKYLEEKGNEKKLANAMRVLEYISSAEGQEAIKYEPAAIPAIRNLQLDAVPEYMRRLWNDSTNSIKSFFLYTGYEHIMIETGQILFDAMKSGSSEGMKEKFISLADRLNSEFLAKKTSSESFGFARDDFSAEQTRKVCCEAFRATAQAQIAIASEGGRRNGAVNKIGLAGKLFKGDIIAECLTTVVASSRGSIVSLSLTGREIREMLETGKIIENTEGGNESFTYWASGVEVSRENGKVTEIKFNESLLDEGETYKVAMIAGDCSEAFAEKHQFTDTGVEIMESLGNYFKAQGTVSPEDLKCP